MLFTPNWDAFWNAVLVSILATPFMFLTLMLFALIALGLSRLPESKHEEE